MIKAEIIAVGDELLIGQVINTNAAWMAWELNAIGIEVIRISAVGDDVTAITDSMREAASRADLILMTGGLGPTRDDITKKALCAFFDRPMRFDEPTHQHVSNLLKNKNIPMMDVHKLQALVPEGAQPVPNAIGTAPGLWFEEKGRIFIAMPGVPFEMKEMMLQSILPQLKERFQGGVIIHRTILTHGAGESQISKNIEAWEDALPSDFRLAYLPQPGIIRLRLSVRGNNHADLQSRIEEQVSRLRMIIPDLIFGYDDDTLEGIVGKYLTSKKQTLATAESCTGGYIAHLVTSVPGSSQYYIGSVVSYANHIKIRELGVDQDSLQESGAVSEQVVREMAEGIRKRFQADYGIATSGIAGPDGGTPEKQVGTVWIAVASARGTVAKRFLFGDDRLRNIRRTALAALNLLRQEILSDKI